MRSALTNKMIACVDASLCAAEASPAVCSGQLLFLGFMMVSGTFMVHVPYRGTGPQLTDLLAGRLDAASVGAPAVMQLIKTGKLRCIATGTTTRNPQLPDVPTVAEQGFPGFEMTQW